MHDAVCVCVQATLDLQQEQVWRTSYRTINTPFHGPTSCRWEEFLKLCTAASFAPDNFGCPADKTWRLRRDYERLELPSQLGVPYDLLEAANPDGLHDLRAGKTISLGKPEMQKACRLQCCQTSVCLQEQYATGLQATVLANFYVPTGAIWQVESNETVFMVAQELSAIANKTIHPYDVIKYNIKVNPAHLRPGTILVVLLARGKCNAEFLHRATQCCKAALLT